MLVSSIAKLLAIDANFWCYVNLICGVLFFRRDAMLHVKHVYLLFVFFAVSTVFFVFLTDDLWQRSNRGYVYRTSNVSKSPLPQRKTVFNNKSQIALAKQSHINSKPADLTRRLLAKKYRFIRDPKEMTVNGTEHNFDALSLKFDSTPVDTCDMNGSTFIIAVVPSAVNNFDRRQLLRRNWAAVANFEHTGIKTVFMLGDTLNTSVQSQVEKEASIYKDIIQTNYIDSYRNLTYKTMSIFKWISRHCKTVPWVLKIDDDVIVNPYNLRKLLERELHQDPSPATIFGRVRAHGSPFRKKGSKWEVSLEEYSSRYYPPFVLGSAYIVGRNAVDKLIAYTNTVPFLYLEDVYFTGLVATKAKIKIKNIEKQYFSTRPSMLLYKGVHIFYVGASVSHLKKLWTKIYAYRPKLIYK